MLKSLVLSVHGLVDFLLRAGDIDNRVYNEDTMKEGTRLHSLYQSRQGYDYISEYFLKDTIRVDDFDVTLFGRADGIILGNIVTVDEIKTTVMDLNEYYLSQKEWHLAQAKCYAYLYARNKNLDKMDVRLTYINQLDSSKLEKHFSFTYKELDEDIVGLIKEYLDFYKCVYNHLKLRNESASKLNFPFAKFRNGQRKLSKYAYGIAKNGGVLFVEAPTGIGKTISTLFPFVKSFASEDNDRIFYLTAKNPGKEAASSALDLLKDNGLIASKIIITAKDKICFSKGKACNPDECPFAKGYYNKARQVIINAFKELDNFTPETIIKLAKNNAICPFELSLDLSLYMDVIICDYNYFFDPFVYLKRFFDEDASSSLVLVDEAHNLIERGRDMYSVSFDSSEFKSAKKCYKNFDDKKIKNATTRISKLFKQFDEFDDGDTLIEGLDKKSLNAIEAYVLAGQNLMKNHHEVADDKFRDFFFKLLRFEKLYDLYDNSFALYISKHTKKYIKINLYCLDPSEHLKRSFNKVKGKVIFSATLSPYQYYIDMIGGESSDPVLMLPSPFKKENLLLLVAPNVSIRYKKRNETYDVVSDYIEELINAKIGNYFVYVPSYEYLEELKKHLHFNKNVKTIFQSSDMEDDDKEAFLLNFTDEPVITTVGFAVVGGAFGEGIDLVSDRLIGIVVIGVGLPQICFERNLIKNYFDDNLSMDGYRYSYLYPGMNKVMQAVGRLIRGENDKGVALLIDDRYLSEDYRLLFDEKWSQYHVVTKKKDISEELKTFYNTIRK